MDIEQLYKDFNVYYQTEGHKHCRPGWANTECPFCTGNPGLHLGAAIGTTVFYCWRCGWKPAPKAVAALTGVSEERAREIIREYGGRPKQKKSTQTRVLKKPFKLPSDTKPLLNRHKRYLRERGFDPDYLEREWGLMSTGPISKLGKTDYRHRIIIPIYWDGRMVSFQARDTTGRSEIKYKACPKEREIIPHQEILYGKSFLSRNTDVGCCGVCVEGVTDAWKMQRSPSITTMATFGIEYSSEQLRTISRLFERVVVLFDDDSQAIVQAKKMVAELRFRGIKAQQVTIRGDPADLSDDEAEQLAEQITRGL